MTEDEAVGWHHQLNGHEIEQTPGDSEGQGRLACYSPWGRKEWDMTDTEGNGTHSSVLAWKIHGQRSMAGYSPWGCKKSDMTEAI